MIIDTTKAVLYSSGDSLLLGIDLNSPTSLHSQLKISNSSPSELQIDEVSRRLYCGTREGLLLIFDISMKGHPLLVHTKKLVKTPGALNAGFVKQMQFDQERRLLICRMSSGVIYFVQTFRPPEESSTFIIEMMQHYKKTKNEKDADNINKICWMSRLNCYCEGTKYGFLKMRDYRNKG